MSRQTSGVAVDEREGVVKQDFAEARGCAIDLWFAIHRAQAGVPVLLKSYRMRRGSFITERPQGLKAVALRYMVVGSPLQGSDDMR